MKTLIALALAGCATAALAAPPSPHAQATQDPLAGSFERMLNHTPTPTAPIDLQALERHGVDPLHAAVNAAIWRMDPPSHHRHTQLAVSTPASR